MSRTVSKLDYSGWTPEQLARHDAWAVRHPLQGALRDVSRESLEASAAARVRMSARDFGNGLKECAVWVHSPDPEKTLQRAIDRDLRGQLVAKAARGDGDLEENRLRAVRRAKQDVRHKCKTIFVNSLWTLTFRENVTDRNVALRCLDAFRRRVAGVLGEWRYVAVLERQGRGAWHIHLATHALAVRIERGGVKVKSWDVMRAIWRSASGSLGGNFDEAKRQKRFGGEARFTSPGRIASYIAGYVAKDMMESELNRKRYSASKGIDIPPAVRAEWVADAISVDLIELAYAAVGDNITKAWFCSVSGVFYVESDDSSPSG